MTLLQVDGLTLVRGDRRIVEDLSFSVAAGGVVALMGPSGTGKTTILRAIAGLDPFSRGQVRIGDVTLVPGTAPPASLHRAVGIVFQFHHLFAHHTAVENVWLAPVHVRGTDRAMAERDARARLNTLGVGDRAHAYPHELSGGEAQRVAIARALALDPPLLLMDEPTAALDPARREELARTIRSLASEGRTVLVATHDVEFVRAVADRVLRLDEGRVVRDGRPGEVF